MIATSKDAPPWLVKLWNIERVMVHVAVRIAVLFFILSQTFTVWK